MYVVPHRGRWAHVTRQGRGLLAQRKRKLGKEFDSRESRIKDKHYLVWRKLGSCLESKVTGLVVFLSHIKMIVLG